MMLNTKSADSAMFIPGISPQLGTVVRSPAALPTVSRLHKSE